MTKAGLRMGYNWYGFSWDICEIYKDLYLGYIYIYLGYGYNATKTWDIIHGQSLVVYKKWSSSAGYDDVLQPKTRGFWFSTTYPRLGMNQNQLQNNVSFVSEL